MKPSIRYSIALISASAVLSMAPLAGAATYTDSTGDILPTASILDITSVEVNNTATDLIFKINLNGDPTATDWGKYMIGIDSVALGDTTGNGWSRPISMSSGMDYWIGGWADWGNGAELRQWTNPGWPINSNPSFTKDTTSVTMQLPFAGLGLSLGNSFSFDVYTSGGGGTDGAIDALGNPAQTIANWNDSYNSGDNVESYTLVPEPSIIAMIGVGGLMLIQRTLRRR